MINLLGRVCSLANPRTSLGTSVIKQNKRKQNKKSSLPAENLLFGIIMAELFSQKIYA